MTSEGNVTWAVGIVTTLNATMNRLAVGDSAANAWYRFVLSYPARVVRQYLECFGVLPMYRRTVAWVRNPLTVSSVPMQVANG